MLIRNGCTVVTTKAKVSCRMPALAFGKVLPLYPKNFRPPIQLTGGLNAFGSITFGKIRRSRRNADRISNLPELVHYTSGRGGWLPPGQPD
jgi:hypothetical protein